MIKMREHTHSQAGFTIVELIIAMGLLAAVITTVAPILMNPQRNLDRAIRKSSERQQLSQQLENLGSSLKKSFPMRNSILDCSAGGNSLSIGFEGVGTYGNNLNSESSSDYKVHEISTNGSSLVYYYAYYDGIAALAQSTGGYIFKTVDANSFKVGDLLIISAINRTRDAAFAKVTEVTKFENNSGALVKVEGLNSFDNAFGCSISSDAMTLSEAISTITYFSADDKKSLRPHTFRIRNIKLTKYSIEAGEVGLNNLTLTSFPFNGDYKIEQVIKGIKNFQIWERWLPDGNDPASEAGQFIGRVKAEYYRVDLKGGASGKNSTEVFKINASYTISKGLRTNYTVVTNDPLPEMDLPEGSLTYALLDDGKQCDFGSTYPQAGWRMGHCMKDTDFVQYIRLTVKTVFTDALVKINVPGGIQCWDVDNVKVEDDTPGKPVNYGLVFNKRKTITSKDITIYYRDGFNLYCALPANTSSNDKDYRFKGVISAWSDEYDRDVENDLNSLDVTLPALELGFKADAKPWCDPKKFNIKTGILKSLKPTYVDGAYDWHDEGDVDDEGNEVGGLDKKKPKNCLWETDDGSNQTVSYCTISQAYDPTFKSVVNDRNLFVKEQDITKWVLKKVRLFPENLIKNDANKKGVCVDCDSASSAMGDCNFDSYL